LRVFGRLPWAAPAALLIAIAGSAAYTLSSAPGQEPPLGQPGDPAAVATLRADADRTWFAGTLDGIRLTSGGPDAGPKTPCPELFQPAPFEATRGTPFEIEPAYLPPGIAGESSPPAATRCQDTIVASGRTFAPSKSGNPWIFVRRALRPEPWNDSYAPADRVSAGTISTRTARNVPAVFVKPVLPDGRGGSYIIFAEKVDAGFVVTVINGVDVTFDELKKFAEGLAR
jgi:hypothetical protein